ncbi:Hypothetical protein NGAL_HAMBI2605_59230 [Neorhizobium galegae bv. orientalis]|nr:Hypothetical protein NGAL_HAMBI2605_59230 [Neorhizobium galegae bv. orientalis]
MLKAIRYLIEGPAYVLGTMAGSAAHIGFILLALAAGIFIGRFLYLSIRIKLLAWPVAIVVGLWVGLVIIRSEPWAAVAMQQAYHHRDDD